MEKDAMAEAGTTRAPPATLTLAEEVAFVSTQDVVTGRVRISTSVDHVEEVAQAVLQAESVEVTRVRIDRMVDAIPAMRTEGDVTIIPIVEEVLVVEKRLVLKEELHIRKTLSTETVEQAVTLRRQHAVIERFDEDGRPVAPPRP